MKKKWTLVAATALAVQAAAQAREESLTEQIGTVLDKQADAWNHGDLDGFMTAYMHSDDISYTAGGTEVWGYDALRKRYEEKYGHAKETMGTLSISGAKVFSLCPETALCIGHWQVQAKDQPAREGMFSLVLKKTKDGWKIFHDHTSQLEKKI